MPLQLEQQGGVRRVGKQFRFDLMRVRNLKASITKTGDKLSVVVPETACTIVFNLLTPALFFCNVFE